MKETGAKAIPTFRHKIINGPNELPDQYSSTPGGTLYSTTPGGTRIIYERNFLMNLKNSPLAKSPPGMAFIPGVTNIKPTAANNHYKVLQMKKGNGNRNKDNTNKKKNQRDDQPQFDMDI